MLKASLKRVYLIRELNCYGLPYGGTNSVDAIYLCNDGLQNGYTDAFVENSAYHEFSSILLRNYFRFWKEEEWTAGNPKNFKYLGNGTDAVREGATSVHQDPTLFASGFLSVYSKASVEEDFNVMSENLFLGSTSFWKAIDSHPRLKVKAGAAMRLYQRIHPEFSEAWFRKQTPSRPASQG